jgi:membrane-associated phospholipid phosphatase
MSKTLFHKTALISHLKQWPFDKQLSLLFPSLIVFIAVITGSWQHIDVYENKVALFCMGLFLVLILCAQPLLKFSGLHSRLPFQLTSRQSWFLYQFWPVPAILLGYLLMRVLRLELAIEFFAITQQDTLMIELDTFVFGQTLPLTIQHWTSPTLTLLMETAYLHFYYLLPIGSLMVCYWRQQDENFLRMRQAIIYTLVGGFCCYFLMPVKGPGDFIATQFTVPLNAGHDMVYAAVNSFRFAYDCFPSLHTAIPWVTLLVSWSWYSWPVRLIMLGMTFSITLSTLYLRYHYGFDVLAGLLWACIVAYLIKNHHSYLSYKTI